MNGSYFHFHKRYWQHNFLPLLKIKYSDCHFVNFQSSPSAQCHSRSNCYTRQLIQHPNKRKNYRVTENTQYQCPKPVRNMTRPMAIIQKKSDCISDRISNMLLWVETFSKLEVTSEKVNQINFEEDHQVTGSQACQRDRQKIVAARQIAILRSALPNFTQLFSTYKTSLNVNKLV